MITKKHTNRKSHNWLAYNIIERFLLLNTRFYTGKLYDLGCGEAPYKEFFITYVDEYIGVDWESTLHNTNADVVANLNEFLPIESSIADTVVSISVMEHLYDPQNMLDEANRILKSGGNIVLQVPWQWWVHEAPHDYFRFTSYALKYMFNKAGFTDVEVTPQSGFFSTWILKFNYFTRRLIRGPFPVKVVLASLFIPAWYIGQKIAPLLDNLDKNWEAETSGYYVTAKKP